MPPLFLIGFMAAGKTSVGRLVAARTERPFIDLDDVIATMGEPVAQLVARDEPEFRRREAEALGRVIAGEAGAVVATGGGAAAFGDNVDRMKAAGCVISLDVDVQTAAKRAIGGAARPLLSATAEALAARRAPSYRRAHAVIDTSRRSIHDVASEVIFAEACWTTLAPWSPTIVALGSRSYGIVVTDRWPQLPRDDKIAVITDRNVARHVPKLGPNTHVVEIEPGEASKSFATYERLCTRLVELGLDRSSEIAAVGGGVVGDLAGFVGATLYRGIRVVQYPTTLVAMTDSAIGGKTAIDLPAGKNLVGAFHQPALVWSNLATLTTLPPAERRAGFGELWKYALLDGPAMWAAVDRCAPWASTDAPAPPGLREVIVRAGAYKAQLVGRDERERTGYRALLNLGHTVGHAIEAETGMPHGEAVALGLVAACRVSAALGLCQAELEAEVVAALDRTGLPSNLAPHLTDSALARVAVDKKRTGDKLRFVAVREVGACEPVEIAVTELRRILRPGSGA